MSGDVWRTCITPVWLLAEVKLSIHAASAKHTGLPKPRKEGVGFFILDGLWDRKDTWCISSELLLHQQQL